MGIEPQISRQGRNAFTRCGLPIAHALVLNMYMCLNLFEFDYGVFRGGGLGWGLAPACSFCIYIYDHVPKQMHESLFCFEQRLAYNHMWITK